MEYSSPLAAMRPQPCPAWGNRRDLPMGRSIYQGYQTYGPNSFDFRTMSMQQKPPVQERKHRDYFSLRPVRGSSPTSSLTADLDANFHIDKSPQAPTPRRSLFTTDLFRPQHDAGSLHTPPIESEGAVTPPIVMSSSPGGDGMDFSPLPHKIPYFVAQVTLPSPSPDKTPDDDNAESADLLSLEEATPYQLQPVQAPTFFPVPERRRPSTRPSLNRNKTFTSSDLSTRIDIADSQLPPFRFGNVLSNGLQSSTVARLPDSYTQSPVEETRPSSAASMLPPPRRPSLNGAVRNTGSPSAGHVRKPSVPRPSFVRPQRKVMRRSLSMFQHPDDIMKEEQDSFEPSSGLSSVMDIDQELTSTRLPSFVPDGEPDSLPRISQNTMADVLNSKYSAEYDNIMVIDCRFEYEFNGGHIENAVNFNDKQLLATQLFKQATSSTMLIFHCEYSVHRAPLVAKFIRGYDRTFNAANYPHLTYPEIYILDGGYSKFYAQHRSRCQPQNYVEMNDQRHEQACERGMAKVKGRQKLSRAQTFAFGQSVTESMEDSPTGQGRIMIGARSQSSFTVTADIAAGLTSSFARRMASY